MEDICPRWRGDKPGWEGTRGWRVGCKDVTFHDVQTTFRTQMAGEGKECSGGRFLNWREDQGVWRGGEGGVGALL